MSAPMHTPGPWRAEQDGSFGRFTIYADGAYDVPNFAVARDVEPQDARLIAAAPELLEALEAQTTQLMIARAVIKQSKIVWMGEDRAAEIQQQARDLIARARGAQ